MSLEAGFWYGKLATVGLNDSRCNPFDQKRLAVDPQYSASIVMEVQVHNLRGFHLLSECSLKGQPQPNEMSVIGIPVSVEQELPGQLSSSGC